MLTRTRIERRPGAVLPLVTVCLIGLLAFVALAIDVGMLALARTQAQSAADVAALAGARTLNGQPGNNRVAAEAEAREAAESNSILAAQITDPQVVTVRAGVYRYLTDSAKFEADFDNPPTGLEAYGLMQVRIVTDQPTYFGKVLGVNSFQVGAEAVAVHRPRDIAISLDFSGSMKFSSQFNYPPATNTVRITGGLNPDPTFPQFGPWKVYPQASPGNNNPMMFGDAAYVDSGGEAHAATNMTVETPNGKPIVLNFQTTAAVGGPNAFVYNGDMSASAFNITNTPVVTPAPSSWTSQYAPNYKGDRWPLDWSVGTTSPVLSDYAPTAAAMLGLVNVTSSTRVAAFETDGYDMAGLTFTNGPFQGYSMGPGFYGKSFYMWPPDPRFAAGADPTSVNPSNLAQDTSGRSIADWRKRFFLAPSGSSTTKGAPVDDNSRLWSAAGVWKDQNPGNSPNYVPNYDAILAWLKSGPQTLPPSLRAGRVLYYSAIPSTIPMNWQTGVIDSSATPDQRFWKDYIDFVLGSGQHRRPFTLYGDGTTNQWGSSNFGAPVITAKSALGGTPKPYMHYLDTPVHPRLHTWFGPLTMLGFLSMDSDTQAYNWMAGTTSEAQCWQLKAGIRAALNDIRKNHPNDQATLNMWSSFDNFGTPRVPMGKNYDKMQASLYYPFSLVDSLGDPTAEKRPYKTATANNNNPSGLDPDNYRGDIPLADGGTDPSMGIMMSYNQFNWLNGYTGRKGATKVVILETDGVANQIPKGGGRAIGQSRVDFSGVGNQGNAPVPFNGNPQALDPALSLAWFLTNDEAGSKPWPSLPAYTNGNGLANGGSPNKWSGLPGNGPGFSTARNLARIHTIAFGQLFEATTTSSQKVRALEFLRNMEIVGNTLPSGSASIESYKIITGTADQRVTKLKEALERIMQGGIQIALIE
jgi:hypothetical protein